MHERLGSEFDSFLESLGKPVPVSIRFNPRKPVYPSGDPIPWCAHGRYLDERPSFTLDPVFHGGGYYVQEASSMLLEQAVIQSVDITKPIVALDLCAAPGGKSTHLLSLLSRDSLLFANEVIRGRVGMLSENLEKWGYENVILTNNDPSDMQRLPGYFDLVVVDAPCSGEGLFRKEPEAMTEWSERNVELCSLRQRRIVTDACHSLKPGGVLIYSTCTYNNQENVDNLVWLADTFGLEFKSLSLDPAWGISTVTKNTCVGYQCFPHRVRGEGFFFAVAQKPAGVPTRGSRTRSKLRSPAERDFGQARDWITDADHARYFLHGPQVRFLQALHEHHLLTALDNLHVISAGTGIGEITRNKIVPDHALALSVHRNPSAFPGIALDLEQAIAYLRKDPLPLAGHGAGYHLIQYDGLGLGWVNVLPGRINNLFPSGRRIRQTEYRDPANFDS